MPQVWSATSNYATLVSGLLRTRAGDRLGRRHAGFQELWEHKFFRGLDPAKDLGPERAPWTPPPARAAAVADADPLRDDSDDDEEPPPSAFLSGF